MVAPKSCHWRWRVGIVCAISDLAEPDGTAHNIVFGFDCNVKQSVGLTLPRMAHIEVLALEAQVC